MPIPNAFEDKLGRAIVDELLARGWNTDRISLVLFAMQERKAEVGREEYRQGRKLTYAREERNRPDPTRT